VSGEKAITNSTVTITILAENTAQGTGLLGEHGLSLWIETPESCVLFDTGQGLTLSHNADALGIALDCADAIVLSHGHYDHTGGLHHALSQVPKARLFIHPSALASRYSRRAGLSREIGMPSSAREAIEGRRTSVVWTTEPAEVAPGMFVTGPVPRRNGFEDTGGLFFLDANGAVPDPIEDDQAMWIETPGGVVVLLGCAHSGVVNTLGYIRERTGGKPILSIVGGMHLGSASAERVTRTIEALRPLNPAALWACHCTGATATAQLSAAFGNRCRPCSVGTRIEY
jgi:7,8-dihydropterin-6-yl-methyl-4-(beta-D-ribofuranosyl)aminobenzene 5'-phosphate synthase